LLGILDRLGEIAINRKSIKFKEPVPELEEISKYALISLLNYYANNEDISLLDMKQYLQTYLESFSSRKFNISISSITCYEPVLVISRLLALGWILPSDVLQSFENRLEYLSTRHPVKIDSFKPVVLKLVKKECSEHLTNIDLYIDYKLYGKPLNFTYEVETQTLKVKSCIEYIDSQLTYIEDDFKNKCLDRPAYKVLVTSLTSLKDQYNKSKTTSKASKSTRAINKNAMVKSVKCSLIPLGSASKVLTPSSVVGKKKLYVYDQSKKLLLCFFSSTGFTFSGTTLKDFTDKSVCVKIKDEKVLTNSLTLLGDLFNKSTTVKTVPHGRFNESMVLLATS
jgi:hypothetical protein